MKIINYVNTDEITAATSLKDDCEPESFNLALHACNKTDDIITNRRKLANYLNMTIENFVFAQQTHSDLCYKVTKEEACKGALYYNDSIQLVDALYTFEEDLLIGVFHADCVPILFYDKTSNLIGAIHSGWQGSVKEITYKTIQKIVSEEKIDPSNIIAFIGPAISYNSFIVDYDVVEKVQNMSFDTSLCIKSIDNNKYLVDNKKLNYLQLMNAGLLKENIIMNDIDTFTNSKDCFSYRYDKKTGRHLSYILRHKKY